MGQVQVEGRQQTGEAALQMAGWTVEGGALGGDFNPYPAQRGQYGELLPMLANGGWDLIQRLKV